jgi:hypothetical protein
MEHDLSVSPDVSELDRDKPRGIWLVVGADHQVGDALRTRVDDGISQLAEVSVGAARGSSELEAHQNLDRPLVNGRRRRREPAT